MDSVARNMAGRDQNNHFPAGQPISDKSSGAEARVTIAELAAIQLMVTA